jgi:dolichol-phosphate mannosyltransferase
VNDSLLIAVPTYNERENIESLLGAVLRLHPDAHALVVDDGSPDGTGDVVTGLASADPRIHLLQRKGKQGIGSAYRAAFSWALARDYAFVVVMDADGSHDPREVRRLLHAAPAADVVVGSRYIPRRADRELARIAPRPQPVRQPAGPPHGRPRDA